MANQIIKLKSGDNYLYPQGVLNGIDVSNKISSTSSGGTAVSSISYTATQDCYVVGLCMVNLEPVIMTIDGVTVGQWANNKYKIEGACTPCKKGQVVKLASSAPIYPSIYAYAIKQ